VWSQTSFYCISQYVVLEGTAISCYHKAGDSNARKPHCRTVVTRHSGNKVIISLPGLTPGVHTRYLVSYGEYWPRQLQVSQCLQWDALLGISSYRSTLSQWLEQDALLGISTYWSRLSQWLEQDGLLGISSYCSRLSQLLKWDALQGISSCCCSLILHLLTAAEVGFFGGPARNCSGCP
jgi:hypothetical protein